MPAATSLPYLPSHLVEQLKKDPVVGFKTSIINFRDTERYRLRVISQKTHPHVPVTGIVPPPEEQVGVDPRVSMALRRWQRTDHKCQLHFAAMELDIPLVHEALRMSNDPSYKDADGVTPLFLALEAARSHIRFGPNVRIEERTRTVLRLSNREVRARVTRIVTLLAEQHGDIDSGFEGRTPLSIAVELSLWEVVEVLLRHGVKTPPIRQLSFKNNDSKVQYLKLVTSIGQVASRPPRRCPCWSGKLLSECHAADWVPYPEEMLCFCGKNKVYGNCCLKRGFKWVERWNERENMFLPSQDTNPTYNVEVPEWLARLPAYTTGINQMQKDLNEAKAKGGDAMRNFGRMPEGEEKTQGYYFNMMLKNNEDYEPAFAHANTKCDFIPRPWRDEFSKFQGKSRMERWNGYIDEYIASGQDKRPRFEIERLSKIGAHGGPLYRQCEAESCERYEGRDVAAFKLCSGCKLTVYCSQECQKAHWKTHKKECGKPNQREQQLPIQEAHERCIQMMPALVGMLRGGMSREDMIMRIGEVMLAELRGEMSQSEMISSPLNQIYSTIAPGRQLETMSAPFTRQQREASASGSR